MSAQFKTVRRSKRKRVAKEDKIFLYREEIDETLESRAEVWDLVKKPCRDTLTSIMNLLFLQRKPLSEGLKTIISWQIYDLMDRVGKRMRKIIERATILKFSYHTNVFVWEWLRDYLDEADYESRPGKLVITFKKTPSFLLPPLFNPCHCSRCSSSKVCVYV